MSERSRPCQKKQWLGLRVCFTCRGKTRPQLFIGKKHSLTFICGSRGSEMGCTVGRPPGGLTVGRGRGVLGLGGLRVCEGVRGRVRACEGVFYPDPQDFFDDFL